MNTKSSLSLIIQAFWYGYQSQLNYSWLWACYILYEERGHHFAFPRNYFGVTHGTVLYISHNNYICRRHMTEISHHKQIYIQTCMRRYLYISMYLSIPCGFGWVNRVMTQITGWLSVKNDAKIHLTETYKVVKVNWTHAIWDITSLASAKWCQKSYPKLHSTLLAYYTTLWLSGANLQWEKRLLRTFDKHSQLCWCNHQS